MSANAAATLDLCEQALSDEAYSDLRASPQFDSLLAVESLSQPAWAPAALFSWLLRSSVLVCVECHSSYWFVDGHSCLAGARLAHRSFHHFSYGHIDKFLCIACRGHCSDDVVRPMFFDKACKCRKHVRPFSCGLPHSGGDMAAR